MEHVIYLAGGCFWGTQHYFDLVPGVIRTQVGYANGRTEHPSYEQVKYEHTGHAETVEVVYDPACLDLDELLEVALESGRINETQKAKILKFRDNPSDENWMK